MAQRTRNKPGDDDILSGMTPTQIKAEYRKLNDKYQKILDGFYCHNCGKFLSSNKFYLSTKWKSGVIPVCKDCLLKIATNYDEKTGKTNENEDSIKQALKLANLPFIRECYVAACDAVNNIASGKLRGTVFQQMIVMLQSLPQYQGLNWDDSDPDTLEEYIESTSSAKAVKKSAIKRFGYGYSAADYEFLENEYLDWTQRYACENKAQELLFKRICFKELEIDKAQKEGRDTKELDKTLQELMASLNLKPSQNNSNALTEAKTFGQLIQKWEEEKPIPEPEEEFKDVDNIGLYIDVFFKGHLSKMMGLKNGFSTLYERFMSKFTVHKPLYDEDSDSEALFDKIFGKRMDEE